MKACLIGNNLTSLILAYILSKKKIGVEIYSTKPVKDRFKTRTLGITDYNINYLNNYFNKIIRKTNPIYEIKVLVKNKKINKQILFNKKSKPLFHMIKYDKLMSYISYKIKKIKIISFICLKKKNNLISILKKKKFDLIINCEVSNILTKKFLKNAVSKDYLNKAFTTIINHKKIINNKAEQIFTEYGPVAFLPLSNRTTSIVFSCELKKIKNICNDDIIKLIKKLNTKYEITSFQKIEEFKLYLRLPKKYYHEKILFFGDSIHTVHPLAGQGLNMTIRDIIKLVDILEQKLNLGLKIDKQIYKDFEKETKSFNSIFSFGIDLIYEYFRFDINFTPKIISEKIFSYINHNKKIKDLGIKFANLGRI